MMRKLSVLITALIIFSLFGCSASRVSAPGHAGVGMDAGLETLGVRLLDELDDMQVHGKRLVVNGFIDVATRKRDATLSNEIEETLENILVQLQSDYPELYTVVERKRLGVIATETMIAGDRALNRDDVTLQQTDLILTGTFKKQNGRLKISAKVIDWRSTRNLAGNVIWIDRLSDDTGDLDAQLQNGQSELSRLNEQLDALIAQKSKRKALRNVQAQKQRLLKRINTLAQNQPIAMRSIQDRNYAYVTVTSNLSDAEIYIDGQYVGIAPVTRFRVPSHRTVEIRAVADKRYYPDDVVRSVSLKRLTTPSYAMTFHKGKAELFLVGDPGRLYINGDFVRELTPDNRVVTTDADPEVTIVVKNGYRYFVSHEDLYAKNLYEITYALSGSVQDGYRADVDAVEAFEERERERRRRRRIIRENTHNANGLMWQDNPDVVGERRSWSDAMAYCRRLSLVGFDDWRLPTRGELNGIVDDSRSPTILSGFRYAEKYGYWSSTEKSSSDAWDVYFDTGGDSWYDESYRFYVRCVRE